VTEKETQIRETAERIADSSHHSSVKRPILDNTLGFLNSTPPVAILNSDESPQFVLFNRKEGVEGDFESAEEYRPSESRGTVLMITDERVVILIGEEDTDRAIAIPYGAIEDTSYNASLLGSHWLGFAGVSRIGIETTNGEYSVPVIKASRGDVKRASRHIRTYCEKAGKGSMTEFEPEIDYHPRGESSSKEFKTILACRKCLEEVARDVERCPHCGFNPRKNTRGSAWKVGAAGLSMTILAPLGIAMGYDSAKKTRHAAKGVWIEKTVEVTETEENRESTSPVQDSAEKLRELEQLNSEGIITDNEFKQKKEEILSEY